MIPMIWSEVMLRWMTPFAVAIFAAGFAVAADLPSPENGPGATVYRKVAPRYREAEVRVEEEPDVLFTPTCRLTPPSCRDQRRCRVTMDRPIPISIRDLITAAHMLAIGTACPTPAAFMVTASRLRNDPRGTGRFAKGN